MKLIHAVLIAAVLGAGLAIAGTSVSSYTTGPAASRPNTPTAGVALQDSKGNPAKAVVINISDVNDAGPASCVAGACDEDYFLVLAAKAWVFHPQDVMPDGGGGWSRWPLADVSTTYSGADVAFGSVTASRGATVSLPSVGVAGTFPATGNGTRLYYQITTATTIDGGSQAQLLRTTIEATY